MSSPLIFQKDTTQTGPTPVTGNNKPMIFSETKVNKPAIFTPVQEPFQPTEVQQPVSFFDKLKQGVKTFGENVSKEGLGGAIADVFIPKEKQQPQEVVDQNMKNLTYFQTYGSGPAILSEIITNAAVQEVKNVANTGAAIKGLQEKAMFGKDNLTPEEKQSLSDAGYLDNAGNIKVGKTVLETGKNAAIIASFFPQVFAPVGLIADTVTGGKVITILGKSVPLARVLEGAVISGTYNTLFTPNLDRVFKDKEVIKDAYKNFAIGATIGTLFSIPLEMIRDPGRALTTEVTSLKGTKDAWKALPVEQQIELKSEYLKAVQKYHPDMPNGSTDAFKKIVNKYDDLDIAWLKQLNAAGPEDAAKLLGVEKTGANAAISVAEKTPKAPEAPTTKPASTTSTPAPKVPETPTTGRKVIIPNNLPPEVTGKSITIRPDGTASFNLEVSQEARGKGIGAQAVKTIEETIAKAGATKIQIPVKEESVGFFLKQGYVVTGPTKNGIVPMEKTLITPEEAAQQKDIEAQIKQETAAEVFNDPRVEQYVPVIDKAIKVYNLNKRNGIDDLATMEKKVPGLDEALNALEDAGRPVETMQELIDLRTGSRPVKQPAVKTPEAPKPVETKLKPTEVGVPRSQLPVGEGEQRVSRLEARMAAGTEALKKMTPEQIKELGTTTYNAMNLKDSRAKAAEYVTNNPEEALKVLTGEIEAPKGLNHGLIYYAMVKDGNLPVEVATKVATLEFTAMGQNLAALRDLDPDSPIKVMNDIIKVREEAVKARTKKTPKEATKDEVKKIKEKIKKPNKYDWNEFIKSIEC